MKFRKLDDFMVKRGGSIDPKKFKDEIFELLSIPAFDKGEPEIVKGGEIGSAKKVVEPKDILLSKIVPHMRRCWIVPEAGAYRQIASGEWIQFRSHEFVPDYVRHFLTSDPFHSQFMKTVTGVGGSLLRARPAEVANIKISLPPLNDQIRIAHLLSKVEGLVSQRKQYLQRLDDLLKSVFLEMFGDPVRNERGWGQELCSEVVVDIQSGTSYGGEEKEYLDADEVGVLKISAVTQGWFNPQEFKAVKKTAIKKPLKFVHKGDFLFSRANTIELVAACCIVNNNYPSLFIPDKLWLLSFSASINAQYFNMLLKNENFRNLIRKEASGGHDSMLNISMKKFRSLRVPVPPIDLQSQFAAIVEKVESIKSLYHQSLAELKNLYGALSQKAFKGELDLSQIVISSDALPSSDNLKYDSLDQLKPKGDKLDIAQDADTDQTEFFNTWAFHKFLRARKGEMLMAADLWEALQQKNFKNPPPTFESFKTWILTCLEQGEWLEQVYGEVSTNKDRNVKEKKVALRIRDDS